MATMSCWTHELQAGPPVLEISMGDSTDRGVPIYWGEDRSLILHSDGQIVSIPRNRIQDFQLTDTPFTPTSVADMRGMLQSEFGRTYEVAASGNYVVVAHGKSADEWLGRFAELEASFFRYFTTRGFALSNPEFPLVAIVFPNQSEFMAYATRSNVPVSAMTLGMYVPMSNRMLLYEQASTEPISTLSTILHEACHQLAFNCGVHQRLSDIPIWSAEGLASVFESPAMLGPQDRSNVASRFNATRFATWQQMASSPESNIRLLKELIESDKAFDADPDRAYALSWALSFYLAERDSSKYVRYMRHISQRQAGVAYSVSERRRDFHKFIGSDYKMLINNMQRFYAEAR
jgi:hypothetical protein